MAEVWLGLAVFGAVIALPFAGLTVWGIAYDRSIVKALDNLAVGWALAYTVGGGLLTLVGLAGWLGHQEGSGRLLPLLAINGAVQPLFALMVAGCCYRAVMGCAGRLTYGFRVMPPKDGEDLSQYQQLARTRAVSGVFGVLVFGGLSAVCLWSLF